MNSKGFFAWAVFLGAIGLFVWGCQTTQPIAPNKNVAMSVFIPETGEVKASLLNVASNELLYRVDGPGPNAVIKGAAGPFSTAASSGSLDFSVNIPAEDSLLLSVQLNDASTHQPLAIGATMLNLLSAPTTDVVVEMGSVTRNCYFVNEKLGGYGNTGSSYAFQTDNLFNQVTAGYDISISLIIPSASYLIVDAQGTSLWPVRWSIAYLGNGNFVDHDVRPLDNYFFPNSGTAKQYAISNGSAPAAATTQIQTGDIYCVLTSASLNYATAWVQFTDPGNYTTLVGGYGPSFRYRVNGTSPYYGYQSTGAAVSNTCSTLW